MSLEVGFCGERVPVSEEATFTIGREGDLIIDDNPFLHRRFLSLSCSGGVWLLSNVGDQLTATVSDPDGRLEAFLASGAVLPIVFASTIIRFTAGPTTYELALHHESPAFSMSPVLHRQADSGNTTVGRITLTPDQHLMVLALAESALNSSGGASADLPSSVQAARRLGWTTTKFKRKLDNVCEKFTKLGVRGLQGGMGDSASNRRARLVEYALAVRVVDRSQLGLLPDPVSLSALRES